jgi:hypothetical protein
MKKNLLLSIAMIVGLLSYAQENNGTVYSKHPAIDKTKKLWSAFEKGDKATFSALLADTMVAFYNGSETPVKKEDYLKSFDWWMADFENLKAGDDTPAYPDAIEYTKGGLWVQDWLLITGRHKKSGINLNLHMHCLYHFNKADKIASIHLYYNNDQFEAINSSMTTQENGKVFMNHPYILTVRKLANAYCEENIPAMMDFYSKDATFSNAAMEWGETSDLAQRKKELETDFAEHDNIKLQQVGYPDCIYYAKDDVYVVYSWWVSSITIKANGNKIEAPIMLSHTFDKEGKIVSEYLYFSTNQLE